MCLRKLLEYLTVVLSVWWYTVGLSRAAVIIPREEFATRETIKTAFDGQCKSDNSWSCLKIEMVKLMDRISGKEEFAILPGISILHIANVTQQTTADIIADIARSFPSDPNQRINGYISTKVRNFMKSHYMRFKLLDLIAPADVRSAITGRKHHFGKKANMEALLAAGVMMKGTLMAMGMGAIALMAGKALMTALMALTLSGVIGLKSLTADSGKSTTYEILAKPIYTTSHSHSAGNDDGSGGHGSSGYVRSFNVELPRHLTKFSAGGN